MRFPDDRKHEHNPPQAEVCVSFWLAAEMHRKLNKFAHRLELPKSEVIRDALVEYMERNKAKYKHRTTTGAGAARRQR